MRFQRIRRSLLNEDIPGWRKRAVFFVQILAITLGVVHFCVYFDFKDVSDHFYVSICVMVAITAITQFVGSWYVCKYQVPTYLWVGGGVWVIVTLFWQGMVVVLWSIT